MLLTTRLLKVRLEALYCILWDMSAEQSQPSILVAFTEGEKSTDKKYYFPWGCGGVRLIDLPKNRVYLTLLEVIIKLPIGYQNILMRKYTTNVSNREIAKENRISECAIKSKIHIIYEIIKKELNKNKLDK